MAHRTSPGGRPAADAGAAATDDRDGPLGLFVMPGSGTVRETTAPLDSDEVWYTAGPLGEAVEREAQNRRLRARHHHRSRVGSGGERACEMDRRRGQPDGSGLRRLDGGRHVAAV